MDSRKNTGKKLLANVTPVPGTSTSAASPTENKILSGGRTQRVTTRSKRVNVDGEDNEDDISNLLDSFSDLLENSEEQESQEYIVTEPSFPRSEESMESVIKDILTDDDLLEKYNSSRETQNKGFPKCDVGLYLMRLDKDEKSVEWYTFPLGSSAEKAGPESHVDILFLSNRALQRNEGDRTAGCRRGQWDESTVNQEPVNAVNHNVNLSDIGTRDASQPLRPKTRRGCFKKREPLGPRQNSRRDDESSGDKLQPMMVDEQDAGTSAQSGCRENKGTSRSSQNNDQRNAPDILDDLQTKTPKRKRFSHFIFKKFIGFKKKIESINCFSCSFSCC